MDENEKPLTDPLSDPELENLGQGLPPGEGDPSRLNRPSVMTGWFLGPKAEHSELWQKSIDYIFQDYVHWRRNYFPTDQVVVTHERRRHHEQWIDRLNGNLDSILNELKAHFPFYSPRYIAHMLSEQTLPSVLGYFAGMLYNPNNVTDEAAPVTVRLELEVGKMVAEMLGFNPNRAWTHICSGGTVANIEALWVARMVQLVPFMIRDFCIEHRLDFTVKTPDQKEPRIIDVPNSVLVQMRPSVCAFMVRNLARYRLGGTEAVRSARPEAIDRVLKEIDRSMKSSKYNISQAGFFEVCRTIEMTPLLFVSASAHYSILKAANVLGYGEKSVHRVSVAERFRLDIAELRDQILDVKKGEYVAAVVGVVGTTEEGAVDPIHKIKRLRDELETSHNKSFWLHVDAAWGGYIRTLFCGHKFAHHKGDLDFLCKQYMEAIRVKEDLGLPHNHYPEGIRRDKVTWDEFELYKSFLAIMDADSVTIDPHKMGYIPYPAGIISFRHGTVTELIEQKAQYISSEFGGIGSARLLEEPGPKIAVGPYVLEGSKPGASAAACWLAHKTIPLTFYGHGKIVKTTLLNARRLTRYLEGHKSVFGKIDAECYPKHPCPAPFTFNVLSFPDTNIVIFVTLPMVNRRGGLERVPGSLEFINKLNKGIYELLSLSNSGGQPRLPYSQPFFVSRTQLLPDQYSAKSMEPYLTRLGIDPKEYEDHGLFVLRSTVMNPFHFAAREVGQDYLFAFVKQLHVVARRVMGTLRIEQAELERKTLGQ